MSILIKGMEMPENCKNCMDAKLNVAVSLFGAMCPFCEKIFLADIDIKKQRLDDCPLVEITTPHGDLVDRDKLMVDVMDSDLDHLQRDDWKEVIQIVSDAETVIEAEGETDA